MRLTVNGDEYELTPAGHETLLDALRERLHLTGTKFGCGRGECGACTVLLDGKSVYACLTLAAACDGRRVITVEGLGAPGALHPLQESFITHDALQCGYCTPGQLLAAASFLAETPEPTDEEIRGALAGNLCRCGTHPKLVRAVADAAARMRANASAADARLDPRPAGGA